MAKILEVKKKKKAEIQELARANLIIIILNSLLYSNRGVLMHCGAVEIKWEKKRTLIVHNCTIKNAAK